MARLIVKSPYIKGSSGKAGGYLEYIGTRDGVELIQQSPPVTWSTWHSGLAPTVSLVMRTASA